jgi:acetolactate synthase I/II/III large subunit
MNVLSSKGRTGGQVLVDALRINGVRTVYCVPGESFLPVLDALYLVRDEINLITCRQEGGATHMAEAYGKITGEPGICFVTRGPGSTNASIAVHTARQDSTPLILFVGQVERGVLGREAWQELDYRQMFGSIAKWVDQVDSADRLPEMISRAFSVATSGRPGPVVLALPEDMLFELSTVKDAQKYQSSQAAPTQESLMEMQSLISKAKKPLLILGGGGWNAQATLDIAVFSESFGLPVACVFRRQDLINNQHPNYVGEIGLGMNPKLLEQINESDLLIIVGARMGETSTNGYTLLDIPNPKQTLIHVHGDVNELGHVYQPTLGINASPIIFAAAAKKLKLSRALSKTNDWLNTARQNYLNFIKPLETIGEINLGEIVAYLNITIPDDSYITNGAGNYTLWVQRFFQYKKFRTQLAPTSGTMGYGLPAAIAAKIEHPERLSICFAGDGCFLMNGQELATAVQYQANVIIIVVNNSMYGSIRMHQERHYPNNVWGSTLANPNFIDLAKAYGAHAELVDKTADFPAAFERAKNAGRPALIEVQTSDEILTPRLTVSDLRRSQ